MKPGSANEEQPPGEMLVVRGTDPNQTARALPPILLLASCGTLKLTNVAFILGEHLGSVFMENRRADIG